VSALALLSPVLDLLYPPRCFVCRELGPAGGFCDACLAAVTPVPSPSCDRCGHPLGNHQDCYHCHRRPPAFVRGRAWGSYEGVLRDAIHRFKYHDRPALAEPLGRQLAIYARTQATDLNNLDFDAIIPVPMHPVRRRRRGYNQSERLARVVARELALPLHSDWLRRIRPTRPQVGLDADARISNLHAAFAADPAVAGKTCLLIDDVTTTSSTLHECAVALKSAGADVVYTLTLAAG
jgi:ComF family protein